MMRLLVASAAMLLSTGPLFAQDAVSYMKDVRPFLNKYCVECHKSGNAKGGANFESFEAIMKGGKKGRKLLIPGDADASRLVTTTEGKSRPVMPPPKAKVHPTPKEVTVLRAWVKDG